MKIRIMLLPLLIGILSANGCSTKISSYPISPNSERKGGVPYFIPKAMLQIKEPIEVSREESLFAVIDVNGLDEYLFKLNENDLQQSVNKLEEILKLKAGSMDVKGEHLELIYLSKHIEVETINEAQHKSKITDVTKEFSILTIADSNNDESTSSTPFYKPADIAKSLSIIWIPDYTREYELVISPSMFATSEIMLTLADGWRLEAITANTEDNNQLIQKISSILEKVVGAKKEVDIAKIEKAKAIKLKELASKDDGKEAPGFKAQKELVVKVKGYVKKSDIKTIIPGLYDLSKILSSSTNGKIDFTTEQATLWSRVKL